MKHITCLFLTLAIYGCTTPAPKELPLTAAEAKAQETREFSAAMASAKDAETQRFLVFAWALRGKGDQAPVQVDHGNRTIGDAVFSFLDRTTERLFAVAPAYFGYKGQVRASEGSERVNESNARVSIANSNNFLALGVAGINGTASIGTAIATMPRQVNPPTTQVTVSGNSGPVNLGSGVQNVSSQNPVNPNPVVCLPGTSTTAGTCSR